ncbi:MAG: hypothetical protein ACTIH7_09560, partial [Brevibacterium aurantiacum]
RSEVHLQCPPNKPLTANQEILHPQSSDKVKAIHTHSLSTSSAVIMRDGAYFHASVVATAA